MFHTKTPANERRQALHEGLSSGRLMRFPGAFNPLSALLVERLGFEGVYVSGAALSASLALPDIGLTTLPEVAARSYEIARTTGLPTLVDADAGGKPVGAPRDDVRGTRRDLLVTARTSVRLARSGARYPVHHPVAVGPGLGALRARHTVRRAGALTADPARAHAC